jgi:hypothetical protein
MLTEFGSTFILNGNHNSKYLEWVTFVYFSSLDSRFMKVVHYVVGSDGPLIFHSPAVCEKGQIIMGWISVQ